MTSWSIYTLFISIAVLSINIDALQHRRKRADCPTPNNLCSFVTCQNGGVCIADASIDDCYRCNCATGYTGKFCDTTISVLPTGCNPGCQNGGVCNINVCNCLAGYTGTFCETRDNCVPTNPCSNGGRCVSVGASFTCDCTNTGYSGALCTELIVTDPCLSAPCQNGGQCLWDGTTMTCACINGYMGAFCQVAPNPCGGMTCENGGRCDLISANTYGCVCAAGYTGSRCENVDLSVHPCVTMPDVVCKNGATCAVDDLDYKCKCVTGWTGRNCETAIATISSCNPSPCGIHGSCIEASTASGTIAVCNCDINWTGKYCDVDLSSCPDGYCLSGGVCRMNGNIGYCDCPALYTGDRCETYLGSTVTLSPPTTPGITLCATNLCENGGTCYVINNVSICSCAPNWTGATCTVPITATTSSPPITSPCASNPCLNAGTCVNHQNTFTCSCLPNWTGPTCTQRIPVVTTPSTVVTPCSPNPCLNNGICYVNGNTFYCNCAAGWTGTQCQTSTSSSVNYCSSQPCKNAGVCYNGSTGYQCTCQTGYTGTNCEAIKPVACPLNCLPGDCIQTGSITTPYACICNGVMKLTSCA